MIPLLLVFQSTFTVFFPHPEFTDTIVHKLTDHAQNDSCTYLCLHRPFPLQDSYNPSAISHPCRNTLQKSMPIAQIHAHCLPRILLLLLKFSTVHNHPASLGSETSSFCHAQVQSVP